jgi:hypothetical protein
MIIPTPSITKTAANCGINAKQSGEIADNLELVLRDFRAGELAAPRFPPSRSGRQSSYREHRQETGVAQKRCPALLSVAPNRETEADRSKGKGPASSRPLPIQPRTESYPFVTTGGGGGALPLP